LVARASIGQPTKVWSGWSSGLVILNARPEERARAHRLPAVEEPRSALRVVAGRAGEDDGRPGHWAFEVARGIRSAGHGLMGRSARPSICRSRDRGLVSGELDMA